jgi:hypothetical protein
MGLVELANLAAVVSAVLGGGQLLLQILPFLQLKGEYETLRDSLRAIKSPQDERYHSVFGGEKDWEELIRWLDYGMLILVPLRRRIARRSIIASGALIALVATTLLDIPNNPTVRGTAGQIEWLDVLAIILSVAVPRLAFFKDWLLTPAERLFIANFHDLEDAFYRREVAPRLDTFNAVFDRRFSHVRGSWHDEIAVVNREVENLRKRVEGLAAKLPEAPVEDVGPPGAAPLTRQGDVSERGDSAA